MSETEVLGIVIISLLFSIVALIITKRFESGFIAFLIPLLTISFLKYYFTRESNDVEGKKVVK